MIDKNNFKALLKHLGFEESGDVFTKSFQKNEVFLKVDFKKEELVYPESNGLKINERQTCNFSQPENAVVFECVYQLLNKGYKPKHIELEPKWKVGRGASGGRADILVKTQQDKPLLLIECKTYGKEFDKAWKDTREDGGQLFSYAQQISATEFLCLYASKLGNKNNTLDREQRIISHKDNEKILTQGENLKSYKKAGNVERRFEVWRDTYRLEYTETGIFESNIQAYQIGKNKYTLKDDTSPATEKDKDGKYHRFRTILRQHNIARKETAFEVLVNLFLAKIVDEEENKNDLEFFWKGVAYDNYYDFIDRLQRLYQIGMDKFLKDEVMYISNEQIDNAFWTVKNKRNATKKQIQKYFRNLKFFSNNAFSLINVHNERLFTRNTKVLVELVQMWQGLRLKTEEQNQFLGDMFEYFLDNSIKQSEGQFFTPLPITKFIVSSLPLEEKIQKTSEPLKAIDYACGSGHFLTEYAHQIKPLVEQHKQTNVNKYYENIIGIEKEDRLAKIAKVSAYMYGQDPITIIEKDALVDTPDVKLESFDVLAANPPFAVEGFLLNLTDKQKQVYQLIETTKSNSNTNTIQCFFIERAKHLMAPDGTVGIIVPSSVLSNSDATHIGTREIILKYFDIVALVELGSSTFGKTGTNTVVLFLKRKAQRPEPAEHYHNRVEDYFEGLRDDDAEYQDSYLIEKYCRHNDLPLNEYQKLFGITPKTITHIDELLKTEIFTTYKKDFESSIAVKDLKKKKFFKDFSPEEKEQELNKHFIEYLYEIEKDKLFYFMLAYENKQKVLIVKSPSDNKTQKQFLGYEWSGAKGSEGIKYNGGNTLNDIITPMFNPKNNNDSSKINYLIRQNFLGKPPVHVEEYKEKGLLSGAEVTYADVADILDFSRKDFNKVFSLSPKKNITVETKWELVKLGEICNIVKGVTYDKKYEIPNKTSISILTADNISLSGNFVLKKEIFLDESLNLDLQKKLYKDDIFICFASGSIKHLGKVAYIQENTNFFAGGFMGIIRANKENTHSKFLYEILNSSEIRELVKSKGTGSNIKNLSNTIYDIKIPLPPKTVQEQIVAECEAIDTAGRQAQTTIDNAKAEIESLVANNNFNLKRLDEVATKISTTIDPNTEKGTVKYIGLENIETNTSRLVGDISTDYSSIKSNKNTFQKNDILYGKLRPNLNKVFQAVFRGICSTDILVIRFKIPELSGFYKNHLLSTSFNEKVLKTVSGQQLPRTSWNKVSSIKVPVPPLSEQKELVAKVEKLEKQIREAKRMIEAAPEKKQQVLDKYLK